jgi:predicted nucleotidyltransferase
MSETQISGPTEFAELNEVLGGLVEDAKRILGRDFVGAYLGGSFALGDADANSDCDFISVMRRQPNAEQEAGLRRLHDEIPTRPGHWTKHLEGSYAVLDDLRSSDGMGRKWLFISHGHRQMEWSAHCNRVEHRWTLREKAVVLDGPPPRSFVAPVLPAEMRNQMHRAIQTLLPDMASWIKVDDHAWAQRYTVTTLCRMLYSADTGRVASKKASLEWAKQHLDPKWQALFQQALEGRALGFDPDDKPSAALVAETLEFAEYAKEKAAD